MKKGITREMIACRIAKELKDGMYVNLGMGIPTLVSDFIPDDIDVILHSENGILGYGRILTDSEKEKWDIDLINASSQPTTLKPGACVFDFALSFCMIRGGHLDVTVLGAYQVSEKGDLANYQLKERRTAIIGGGMDLAVGAKRVFVAMEHVTPGGELRIVKRCTLPLTGKGVVDAIVTNLAYIVVTDKGLLLKEIAPGVSVEEVQALTEPKLLIADDLAEMRF